jgi:hypothetical protein
LMSSANAKGLTHSRTPKSDARQCCKARRLLA